MDGDSLEPLMMTLLTSMVQRLADISVDPDQELVPSPNSLRR